MADEVPVCDVLCEAMEYLSKLGSNLRARSETLKEKRISKDKLKNAHAVQKAASKVLLICQLSKKSLENVESGVKKILTLVDASQASTCDGGKSSNADKPTSKKSDYQYFEYRSLKLKVAKRVSIKHYMSAKVMANSIPKSIQDKYPVYYDCKLYRYRKRKSLKEKMRRERSDRDSRRKDAHAKDESIEKKRNDKSSRELVTPEFESDREEKKEKDRRDSKTSDYDNLIRKGHDKQYSSKEDKKKLLESDSDDSCMDSEKAKNKKSEKIRKNSCDSIELDHPKTSDDDSDINNIAPKKMDDSINKDQKKSGSNSDDSCKNKNHEKAKNKKSEKIRKSSCSSIESDHPNKPDDNSDINNIATGKMEDSNKDQMKSGSDSYDSCKNKNHEKAKNKKSEKKIKDSCSSIELDHPKKSDDDSDINDIAPRKMDDSNNKNLNKSGSDSDDSYKTKNREKAKNKKSEKRRKDSCTSIELDHPKKSDDDSDINDIAPKKMDDSNNKDQKKSGSDSDDSCKNKNHEKAKNKKSDKERKNPCRSIESDHPKKSDEDSDSNDIADRKRLRDYKSIKDSDDKECESNEKTNKDKYDYKVTSDTESNKKSKSYSEKSNKGSGGGSNKDSKIKNKEKADESKDFIETERAKDETNDSKHNSNDSDASEKSSDEKKHRRDSESIKLSKKYSSHMNVEKRRKSTYISSDTDEEVQTQKPLPNKEDKTDVNVNEEVINLEKDDVDDKEHKPLIKLVNINKLLKPDILQKEQFTKQPINEKQNKENELTSQSRESPRSSAMKSSNKNDRSNPKFKKVRYEDEEKFWAPKRKEVEDFMPKKFTINIYKVPKLSKLLHEHNLRKIIQNGSIVCKLYDDTISPRDSPQLSSRNGKNSHVKEAVQVSDLSTAKRSLLVDSDSDKCESSPMNTLTCETENVKISSQRTLLDESDSEKNNQESKKDEQTAAQKKKNRSKGSDENHENIKKTLVHDSYPEKNVNKNKDDKSKESSDGDKADSESSDEENEKSQRTSKKKKSTSKRRNTDEETEKSQRTSKKKKSTSKRRNTDEETDSVKNNLLQESDSDSEIKDDKKTETVKNDQLDGLDSERNVDQGGDKSLEIVTEKTNSKSQDSDENEEVDTFKSALDSDSEKNDEQDSDKDLQTATKKKQSRSKCSNEGDETNMVKNKLLVDTDSEKNDEDSYKDLQTTTKKQSRKSKDNNENDETNMIKNKLLVDTDSEKNDEQDSDKDLQTATKKKHSRSKGNNEDESDIVKNKLLVDTDSEKNDKQDSDKDLQMATKKKQSRKSKDIDEDDETNMVKNKLLVDTDSEKNDEQDSDKDLQTATKKKQNISKGNNEYDETDIVKNKLLDSDSDQDNILPTELNENNSEISCEEIDVSLKDDLKENTSLAHSNKTQSSEQENNKTPDKEITPANEDPDKVKSSLINDSFDKTPKSGNKKRKRGDSTPQSKRKHIMESMHAKKMLLTYSSSSETEDEQLKEVFKEIKKSLLKSISSDEEKGSQECHRRKLYTSSDSDEDILKRAKKKKKSRSKRSSVEEVEVKKESGDENKNEEATKDHSNINQIDGTMDETSNSSKMGRSREKAGGSSRHSDNQEDKDVDSLTNLVTLNMTRRRRGHTDKASTSSKKQISKALPPLITGEGLLEAPTSSSDEASAANSDAVEEDLPPVTLSDLNGGAIDHLAKDDLLVDSDSSSSNDKDEHDRSSEKEDDEDKQENESDSDKNVKTKRRKAHAISSGSEAGSSRPKGSHRNRVSDFEDSEADSSDQVKKKKRKKKAAPDSDASGGSSNEGSKKKRRRIKQIDDSDASGSDSENEGKKHGRKNIRKVMGKNQLEEATKKAAREERERCARIAERQKMYNNLEFDESGKPDEVVLDKVVLDFDPETKKPLIELDRGLVKKLKPHQANGIKFMWDACFESVKRIKKDRGSGCILAHCMGLGKTLQVVSLTHTLLIHSDMTSVNRVLVVCPLSTVLNWVNEFRMWLKFAETDFEVDIYELSRYKQNSERAFQLSQWFEHGGVCVLGYEMFRNLSADNNKKFKKKMLKNFQESLVDPGPDMVVCDEGHLLKNEKTSLSQSMNRVKTHRRIVLTGTPLQNNLKEYYCMVQFVKPNLLGKYNEYLNRFVNPITNGQYTDSTEHDIRIMKRRSHVLHKMLDGAVQRRDYGVLAPFLPPKHEYVLFITLTDVQIKLYQHYLDNYSRRPQPGKSSGFLFPDYQSMQRIWTHPLVLKYNSERYEIMQQKKRDKEEEDSEGSLADFIDDESTPDESSSEESSADSSDMSDDSRKKSKKKKNKKSKKESKVTTGRATRANPVEQPEEEEVKDLELMEVKNDNPTEWWIPMVTEDEVEDMRNSHKLVLLFEILRQCEAIGDKLLVFSQSLYSLDLIEHFLGKVDEATQEGRIDDKLGRHVGSWSPGVDYFRLDGSTSCENRSIWCKNFNREDNPRARLFLISTRAGGLGINLVAANRVIIFDVSWNPSHDVQSIFRVYRFGQKKPCYIYRFLVMGTMEEKIYERQVTKQAISKRVIDEQQIDRHYAENDLAELYKFEPRQPEPRPVPLVPKDRLFAEMLKDHEAAVYKFHEHDSLLENKEEETLSEEERKAAWEDFENEKNKPPPMPFANTWPMHNGMVPNPLAQQQLAYAALASMLRKDMPNLSDDQVRGMLPIIYGANPSLMQKLGDIYKYPQPSMMNPAAMMNPVMNPGGGAMGGGGSSGLQYEPPWARDQQNMRLQQLLQQQNQMGAKYYAGGLGSRDPVAMALQQQRAREIMLGEQARQRGRPPLQPRAPPAAQQSADVVNLADSD